jgi:DNA polymerase iota
MAARARAIVHLDLDCFYAQVFMVAEPALRTRPVGVKQKTIFATVNYVARQRGVPKMATIKQALEVCPDMVILDGEDLAPFRKASNAILELLQSLCPGTPVERLGLDEFFVDATALLTGFVQTGELSHPWWDRRLPLTSHFEGNLFPASPTGRSDQIAPQGLQPSHREEEAALTAPLAKRHTATASPPTAIGGEHQIALLTLLRAGSQLAKQLRQTLRDRLGYTASAGIAHNKLLAKMAGELHKPDNQTTLLPEGCGQLLASRGWKRVSSGLPQGIVGQAAIPPPPRDALA